MRFREPTVEDGTGNGSLSRREPHGLRKVGHGKDSNSESKLREEPPHQEQAELRSSEEADVEAEVHSAYRGASTLEKKRADAVDGEGDDRENTECPSNS